MRKLSIFILSMVFSLSAFAADNVNAQLVTLLSAYQTYQANFTQLTKEGNRVTKTTGKVMIKRPGKFRWEANQPLKQVIIVNDKTMWTYDIELAQASEQTIKQTEGLNPVYLLSGDAEKISRDFTISQVKDDQGTWFKLVPISKNYPFKWVQMQFSNKRLSKMQILNNFDQLNTLQFNQIKLNGSLPNSLFIFKAPRGVDVIKQSS